MSSRIPSATSFKVASSVSPETTTEMVLPRNCNEDTIGFSVSLGKVLMASTRLLTSLRVTVKSASAKTSRKTVQAPSDAVAVMRSIPSKPSMASSTRIQTAFSASTGAAPKYGIVIWMMPGSILGNSSLCIEFNENTPPTNKINISRLAATGLSANQAILFSITASLDLLSVQGLARPACHPPPSELGTS